MVRSIALLLLLSLGLLVSFPVLAPVGRTDIKLKLKEDERIMPFTPLRLKHYLDSRRSELPDREIVYAQAILETGHFVSAKCVRYNNLFGLKKPKYRATTAISTYQHSATYKHWTYSVDDYILRYQYFKQFCSDTTDYYRFLRKTKYSTNKHYEKTIRLIVNELKRE